MLKPERNPQGKMMTRRSFKFRKTDQIGAAAAEEDEFLSTCFVDTGDLALLEDTSDHRLVVLGRTGSGKTALLRRLTEKHSQHAVCISPENLALTYVSNSTILNFFAGLGVNLDPFFKLLWRHVFVVEVLNRYFEQRNCRRPRNLLDRLRSMFSENTRHDKEMKEALAYLEQWGKRFWLETEFRVKEIARKVEQELDAEVRSQLGVPVAKLASSAGVSRRLTEEEKAELRVRGQEVIAAAQVQDLHKVLSLLDSVLEDRQKPYWVIIDNLDENWVEEKVRYRLIMALIVTAREFFQIRNAKVIVALRRDLIDRVFRLTRDSGFQEEKYQSLYLPLVWEKSQIIEVLDTRIEALVSDRYTKQPVSHTDLLPSKVGKVRVTEYLTARAIRPRDIIAFFNHCIAAGTNLARLGAKQLSKAEGEYSRSRLRALGDEWSADYPALLDFAKLLQRRPASFKMSAVVDEDVEELCLEIAANDPGGRGVLQRNAMKVVDCILAAGDFKVFLMQVFYRLGLVGLKAYRHEGAVWAAESGRGVSAAEIGEDTSVVVHPMYHRALGIRS